MVVKEEGGTMVGDVAVAIMVTGGKEWLRSSG